jgi:hypothetical protein
MPAHRLQWSRALVAAAAFVVACAQGAPTETPQLPSPPTAAVASQSADATTTSSLNLSQARGEATVVAFLNAYNAGDFAGAFASLSQSVVVTDCDYRTGGAIRWDGKDQAANWLRERIEDHDGLVLQSLQPGVPNEAGSFAMALSYERRTSDTLRALGFPNGITPQLATKAILSPDGQHMDAFINGSDSTAACRP